MAIPLKRALAKSLVGFLKTLVFLIKIIGFLLRWLVAKPLASIGKFIFQFFVIRLYKLYFVFKKYLGTIYLPSKDKLLYPLTTRYIAHVVIIGMTVLVATNSLQAQAVSEEVGQKSLLSALIKPLDEGVIVETAESITGSPARFTEATGNVVATPKMEEGVEVEETTTVTQEGAIVKPSLVATTIGDRPRDEVIYHTVEGGETVSEVAERYKVSTNTLLWENKLGPRDFITPGQKLTILPLSGVSHQVKSGDTVEKIAKRYGVDAAKIVDYNKLATAEAIKANDILVIPDGVPPAPPAPTLPSSRFAFGGIFGGTAGPSAQADYSTNLQWPTPSRKINQYFRWRHTGVDIDGNSTSPIYAADTGRVEAVGWEGGYGRRVVLNHGDGLKTMYAHISKAHVNVGDSVSRGQTIATVGCTGWCTGTHVHFEVWIGGRKVNPLSYL